METERNGGQTVAGLWIALACTRDDAPRAEQGEGTRGGKNMKKKNDRVNKDRPVSHARDHCYYISRGVLFPWENWTGPFYHL